MKIYLRDNVYEAALKRIERIFDEFTNVIVSISGGKDSTAVMEMTLEVARAKNRLPLKVMFIDQEAEWRYTVDYMRYIKSRPELELYWFQVPLIETNAANHNDRYLKCWDPEKEDIWIRKKEPGAITGGFKSDRFKGIFEESRQMIFNGEPYANIGGVLAEESLVRFGGTTGHRCYKDITWGKKEKKGITFYPIYDWTFDDIWIYIAKNKIRYNHVYDLMFNYGIQKQNMRVSSLHHETAYRSMLMLQEIDRETYDKLVRRLDGVSTFSQLQDQVVVKELPGMFGSWLEYRDYLLVHLIKPELWNTFRNRWKNQFGDAWYKEHVQEIMVNDTEGTKNANFQSRIKVVEKTENGYYENKYDKKGEATE